MYCKIYLRHNFYNLNCILMMTCILVETTILMFPTLSLLFIEIIMSDNNTWNIPMCRQHTDFASRASGGGLYLATHASKPCQ